jgi:hypothetical protein
MGLGSLLAATPMVGAAGFQPKLHDFSKGALIEVAVPNLKPTAFLRLTSTGNYTYEIFPRTFPLPNIVCICDSY